MDSRRSDQLSDTGKASQAVRRDEDSIVADLPREQSPVDVEQPGPVIARGKAFSHVKQDVDPQIGVYPRPVGSDMRTLTRLSLCLPPPSPPSCTTEAKGEAGEGEAGGGFGD